MTKKWLKTFFLLPLLIVVLLSLPGISDLFKSGYYTSHDGEGHVIRMDEFYHAFIDGQFPVRWSKRLYFGYGYPFFNFNYPSTYYFGLPPMLLGFSATTAMKAETVITYVLSAVVMFLYLRRKVSWQFAIVGAVLYSYAPYRLLNIYVRGSVAESTAFLFPPLLLWTAELLAERKAKAILWAAVVLFFLGFSHNISALLLFGFFFTYTVFLSVAHRSFRPFISGVGAFLLGLMMSAFFFIPALAEKKYTFLDQTIAKDYPDHFLYLLQLLKGGWDYGSSVAGPNDGLSFNIGWVQLGVTIIGGLILFGWKKGKLFRTLAESHFLTFIFFGITILLGAVFFMSPISLVFWDHLPLLPFVQFPWRFLLLTVPVLAVMSALVLEQLTRSFHWKFTFQLLLSTILIVLTLFIAKDQWHINQPLFSKTIPGDALEGSTTWADEQATHWFLPKPNKIPVQKIEFLHGPGTFHVDAWLTGKHLYLIAAPTTTTVVENTMYYPGWKVFVDGKETVVDYQNKTYPGRLVYEVSSGEHHVMTVFTETPSRKIMDLLSIITMICVFGGLMWPQKKASENKKKRKGN
jgi:uncharacterized membrane protein